jgi:serpin B
VTDDVRSAAASGNEFAFDLYGQLRDKPGNLFFSPASISTALAMVYAGARGETEAEMTQTLHLELPDERLMAAFGALGQVLNSEGAGFRLSTANRLWGQKSYVFRPDYLQLTREQFGAELSPLDFARSEQSRQTINRWVMKQTNDKISDLIPPGALDAMTRLVLTNAIYFKGDWEHEFSKDATKDAPFHLSKQKEVQAPLMHQWRHFDYAETDKLQIISLPYAGYSLSLVVVLPKEVDGLPEVEREMTAEKLLKWSSELRNRDVQLWLPKFKSTSQFMLADALRSLGMTLVFSDDADLSGIASGEELKISAVIHKAYVDVNEEGTEAAAATAVPLRPTAAPIREPEKPVVFRADHPFIYLIRDNRTGAILFLGRLAAPGV